MNKYELTVVVNAKIEDDVRVATVEKVKEYVARYGGTVTNVDEWGKKRLAYENQKMNSTISSSSKLMLQLRQKSKDMSVSWKMLSDIYV